MTSQLRAASGKIATQSARPQIDALDGLRAIAALMVLTTHVGFHTGLVTAGAIGAAVSRLDLGVCVFFLLSGFLLYRPWARAAMVATPGPAVRSYARKRFARVYPAYALLVVVVLGWAMVDAPADWQQWLAYLTLTHVYVPDMAVTELNQTWSLATEVAFYALLPVLAYAAGRRHCGDPDRSAARQCRVLAVMLAISLAFHLVRAWTAWLPDWLSSFWLPGFLDWFAAGMLLAVAQARLSLQGLVAAPRWMARLRLVAHDEGTSLTVAALCFAIAATPMAGKYFFDGAFGPDVAGPWAILFKHYLYAATAFFLLLPLVLGSADHWYARAMASPLMRRLGLISYGIFLWHLLVLTELADLFGFGVFQGGFWLLWPATVLVTAGVATLSWHLLERPILLWAHGGGGMPRRLRGRRARAPGPR
jgi:peptidoglycan/LPS O-acetylase OafA/YrhL